MKILLRYSLALLSLPALLGGCSEAAQMTYNGPAAVYISMPKPTDDITQVIIVDTITYSFASYGVDTRAILVPVEITGAPANRDREFHIEVTAAANTVAGVDYVVVNAVQTMPAGASKVFIPVTFLRNASMMSQSKRLDITVKDGGDFVVGVVEKLHVTVRVSDMLAIPDWWKGGWLTNFGPYHIIKHKEWLKIWGSSDFGTTAASPSWSSTPQQCVALLRLKNLFLDNEFYDENNIRLLIPYNG